MVIGRRSLLLAGVAAPVAARGQCVTDTPSVDACLGGVRITQPPGVTLDLSFFGPTLDPSLTFTRASTATYFDATGTMQTAAINAPRFDYDPVTHTVRGLLIEEARTNGVRNGNATGAIPGTPGTMPTNWATMNTGGGGIAFNVIGSGVESGMSYVDIRIVGTPINNVIRMTVETTNGIAAATGQTWTNSYYARLAAGTLTNVTNIAFEYQILDASQTPLATNASGITFVPTAAGLSTQRASATYTLPAGAIAFVRPTIFINIPALNPIDFTLRIGGVQMEQGAFPTSYIPTTAAAVTRSADACSRVDAVLFGGTGGKSISVDAYAVQNTQAGTNCAWASLNDGGANNMYAFTPANSGAVRFSVVLASVSQFAGGDIPIGARPVAFKAAIANGATVSCAGNGTLTIASGGSTQFGPLTTLNIGYSPGIITQPNGYIRRVRYWPRLLSNAELQQVTR